MSTVGRRRSFAVLGTISAVTALVCLTVILREPAAPPVMTSVGTLVPSATPPPTTTLAVASPTNGFVPVPTSPPVMLSVPKIEVRNAVVPVGLEPGTNVIQIPDLTRVGWYQYGPLPGDPGSAVLVGHLDGDHRTGVFWRLGELTTGDPVLVTLADGTVRTFTVVARQQIAKTALPPQLFERGGPARLALITCGGAFDRTAGHYADNVVVMATPTPQP